MKENMMRVELKKNKHVMLELVKSVCLKAHSLDDDCRNRKILRNNINLMIMSKLVGPERNTLLPGTVDNGTLTLRNKNIRVDLKSIQENFPAAYRIARPELRGNIPEEIRRLCSIEEMRGSEEFAVRLVAIANPIAVWADESRVKSMRDWESEEKRITEQLAYCWGIRNDLSEDIPLPDSGSIHSYPFSGFFETKGDRYIFKTDSGAVIYSVERRMIEGRWVELPVTNYISGNGHEFPAYRMPLRRGPSLYPLMHLDYMTRFPDTPVLLTDIPEMAYAFNMPDEKLIVSGFYGGLDTVSYTDVRPLFGNRRQTYFLLLNPSGCADETHTWQIALKLMENFRKYDRTLRFILPIAPTWKASGHSHESVYICSCRGFEELTTSDVLSRCRKFKLFVPESLEVEELHLLSGSEAELVGDEKPYIAPIANEGSFVIFYANAKAGKTFLALHVALSMAYGCDPFPNRWTNAAKTPHRVLYVSGEMSQGIFKKRKMREDQFLKPAPNLKDNIMFIHLRDHAITDADGQKYLERHIDQIDQLDMIVFDNWQSLCGDAASSRSSFNQFYRWIAKWLDAGIHLQLINHTTKGGMILGSGAFKAQCDTTIRLYRASDDDEIRILVTTDDVRDGKRSLFKPFLAEYNFDDECSGWKVRILSEENCKELIEWNENEYQGSCPSVDRKEK